MKNRKESVISNEGVSNMGEIILREPSLDEFEAVQEVFQDVWDMHIMRETYAAQIYNKNASVIGAYLDGEIIGVISSFMSVNKRGKKRWEIDLIAVKKSVQGKGIGTRLVQESLERGEALEGDYARALIRIGNIGSQKAFEISGFKKQEGIYNLILWETWSFKEKLREVQDITYLPMETLSYRGLWIEDLFSRERSHDEYKMAINYAQQLAKNEKRDNTGATILKEDVDKLPRSIVKQSANHGKYNWWTMDLKD